MLSITDFKVDGSDDLLIIGDDLCLETDTSKSAFRCGERRCQSRYDDFILSPEISAGIETVIHKYINDFTIEEIHGKVRSALQYHDLFSNRDFKIFINQDGNDPHKLKVMIVFSPSSLLGSDSDYNFSIVVNIENQRAFR